MKPVLFVAALLFATAPATQAQTSPSPDGNPIEIKVGTQLVYDVAANGKTYQFIITIKKLEEGVSFDWKMTDPVNQQGSVEMTEDALESAHSLMNYMKAGATKLTDKTCVWLSRQVWQEIHTEDEMTLLSLDEADATGFFREDGAEYITQYKGAAAKMKTSVLKSLTDTETITVWENEKFPIILSMNLGWTIDLKEIK